MAKGFLYLVAIMDWYSRHVVAWRVSNTLDADFCVEALEEALSRGPLKSLTPTKGASSPARDLAVSYSSTASESAPMNTGPSAWTGRGDTAITSSWRGCGAR